MKLRAAPDSDVTTSFAAENNSAASHFHYAIKLKVMKFARIKVVGFIEELQLITFCDNLENVEARSLHSRSVGEACLCCEI